MIHFQSSNLSATSTVPPQSPRKMTSYRSLLMTVHLFFRHTGTIFKYRSMVLDVEAFSPRKITNHAHEARTYIDNVGLKLSLNWAINSGYVTTLPGPTSQRPYIFGKIRWSGSKMRNERQFSTHLILVVCFNINSSIQGWFWWTAGL